MRLDQETIPSNLFLLREMNHTKHGNFWLMEERSIEEINTRLPEMPEEDADGPSPDEGCEREGSFFQ